MAPPGPTCLQPLLPLGLPHRQPHDLAQLLPAGARGFAVLDLETTGLDPACRVVEIAVVRLDRHGAPRDAWQSLVNPGIPIPNAAVHGIDNARVAEAPSFARIAASLARLLTGQVLVAHNLIGFDRPILARHFAAVPGLAIDLGDGIDTMPQPRLNLARLCARQQVELDPTAAHTALGDARALAAALRSGLDHLRPARSAVHCRQPGPIGAELQPTPISGGGRRRRG